MLQSENSLQKIDRTDNGPNLDKNLDNLANWPNFREPATSIPVSAKTDTKKREVSDTDARRWAGSHGGMPYFETSAKDGENVVKAFEKLFSLAAMPGKGSG